MSSILAVMLLLLLSSTSIHAASSSNRFVDLDGDGFNDNLVDSDNNNIPDVFESAAKVATSSILSSVSNVSSGLFSESSSESSVSTSFESRADHFSSRLSGCLGLDKCRNNFESDFSGGIGFSLGSGGGCVGGVCF
jgi:hypothetical protein